MDRNFMARLVANKPVIEEPGICCGDKMEIVSNRLSCLKCGKLSEYLEAMFEEVKSQGTQYNHSGKIMFGKSQKKTDNDKIISIAKEFEDKIKNKLKCQIPPRLIRRTSILMYKIIKDDNGKKKSNRDQLFAACLHLLVIREMNVYSIEELVKMFGLDTYGIGNGKGHIIKYIMKQIELGVDTSEILRIPSEFEDPHIDILSINIDISLRLITKHLTLLKINYVDGEAVNINTGKNRKFCMEILDFINNNSIAYNTNTETKCVGVVYYLLTKRGLASTLKKSTVAEMLNIYQSIMMGVFNLLCCPEVQSMLTPELRL